LVRETEEEMGAPSRAIKRVAKTVVRDLPLEPLAERALKQALADIPDSQLAGHELEHRLEDAVRETLEDTVSHIVRETVATEARA